MSSLRSVPILTCHHVHPDGHPALDDAARRRSRGHIGASVFRSHLELLLGSGWQVCSTSEIVDWLLEGSPLPSKAAAIHFDNGWFDTWETAGPILDEFGIKALVYVISDLTEKASRAGGAGPGQAWSLRTRTEGQVSSADHTVMSWRQVEDLLGSGWEVGAHTVTHPKLTQMLTARGMDAVQREIEESNQMLQRRLGVEPVHFAYPSGDWNEDVERIVSPYYRSLRLWRLGPPWYFTNSRTPPSRLECQNIDAGVSLEEIRAFLDAAARGETEAS